jgi:hypothetical protein
MKHVPTPYNAEYVEDSDALLISGAPNKRGWGVEICTVASEDTAEFIVHACNSHATLVEALKEAEVFVDFVIDTGGNTMTARSVRRKLNEVLQQLKENDNAE